jgi:O-antigen/teichoic acid export membrane protein
MHRLLLNRFRGLKEEHRLGISGAGWSTLSYFLVMGLRLVSTLILTRLLGPEQYGIFGPVLTLVFMVELLTDIGLRPGLLRHAQGMEKTFLGTGWTMAVIRSFIVTGLQIIAALTTSWWSPHPELHQQLILVLSFRGILHALQNPNVITLYKHLQYFQIAMLEVSQAIVSVACTLAFAYFHPTVWAFVFGMWMAEVWFVLLSYIIVPRTTKPAWNRDAVKELSHFGNQVFLNTMVMAFWQSTDKLLGIHLVSDVGLGWYFLAWNLSEAAEKLISKLCDVYYGVLTRHVDEQRQSDLNRQLTINITKFGMPILMIGVLIAPIVVRTLYAPQYQSAGVLFAILLARLMIRTLSYVQFQYFVARGEVYLITRCYIIALVVQLLILFPLCRWAEEMGMAFSILASTLVFTMCQNAILVWRGEISLMPIIRTLFWVTIALGFLPLIAFP